MLLPFLSVSQSVNQIDNSDRKQGVWTKTYKNGNVKYKGQFKDDKPQGLFYYYYSSGELQAEKEFFHNVIAAATHIFYKNVKLKAAGIYVNELKDSTWNYYNRDRESKYRCAQKTTR